MMLRPIGIYAEHCGECFPSILVNSGVFVGQDELAKIRNYLASAPIVIASPGIVRSVFDETQVSGTASMRTDGQWIWHDTFAFYVGAGRIGIDESFLTYIRGKAYSPPCEAELDLNAFELPW